MPGRLLKFSLIFVLAQYHPIHIEPTPILTFPLKGKERSAIKA